MDRRSMLVATGGVVASAMAGCLGGDNDNEASPAQSGTPTVERRDERTNIVSSSGEVADDPDLAVLEVGVESTGDTAGAVRDDLATRAEDLRQALLDFGLKEDAITTNRFYINERLDRQQMEEDGVRPNSEEATEEYVYYQGTHSFRVEVTNIDDVGTVIDTAVDAGADDVGSVTFTLSDEKRAELREEALRQAIQDARAEAETIADEVGATIAEVTVIDASDGSVSPVRRQVSYAADTAQETEAPTTSVEPGEVTVTAHARVQYRME